MYCYYVECSVLSETTLFTFCGSFILQVTLSIELNDSQLIEFERIIPVQLAQPPWNYTLALSKGIRVYKCHSRNYIRRNDYDHVI